MFFPGIEIKWWIYTKQMTPPTWRLSLQRYVLRYCPSKFEQGNNAVTQFPLSGVCLALKKKAQECPHSWEHILGQKEKSYVGWRRWISSIRRAPNSPEWWCPDACTPPEGHERRNPQRPAHRKEWKMVSFNTSECHISLFSQPPKGAKT